MTDDLVEAATCRWRLDTAIAAVAARMPDHPAFIGGAVPLTMAELDRAATVLAAQIIATGLPAERFIAVAMRSITGFAVAALAASKCGCAYVPVDLRFPLDRARELLASGIADLIVTDDGVPAALLPPYTPVLPLDLPALVAAPPVALAPRPAGPVAYVCFTSGSTGAPKGVLVPHAGIEGLICDPDFPVFRHGGRTAQVTTFAFDASTLEVWGSLVAGSTLVEVPPALLTSPSGLARFLAEEAITAAWFSTGFFNVLIGHDPHMFAGMDTAIIGGEAADPAALERLFAAGRPPRRLLNGYGPTEATVLASWHEITAADAARGVIPIGRPMAGRRLLIVDEALQPVAPGESGELLIAGPAVAHGYWQAPERTAERFLADPERPGGQIYRTGDLCRYDEEGRVLYLGRIDDQVKIRGFRVEPGYVARELAAIDPVEEAVVLARASRFGGRELVGFVTLRRAADPAALRSALAARVADFMVPSLIVAVERLPLNPNGKLDRRALLALAEEAATLPVAAATPTEQALMALFEAPSPATLLADLAPDSLAQVGLLVRLEQHLDRDLEPEHLAGLADIAALAAYIDADPVAPPQVAPSAAQNIILSLPWALNALPPVVVDAIAKGGQHRLVPLAPDALADPATAVDRLAEASIARIVEAAPSGPIVLAGYSVAGVVAAEVAQRLVARGRAVELLILIDADFGVPPLGRRLLGRLRRRRHGGRDGSDAAALLWRAKHAVERWRPQPLAMPVIAVATDDPAVLNGRSWRRWAEAGFAGAILSCAHLDLVQDPAIAAQLAAVIVNARRTLDARSADAGLARAA